MSSHRSCIVVFLVVGIGVSASSPLLLAGSRGPVVGDEAPAFELPGSDGKTYSLADFRGKKAVVLAWFPKAFTGG
jgi:peroxiredoxin Q/BCP